MLVRRALLVISVLAASVLGGVPAAAGAGTAFGARDPGLVASRSDRAALGPLADLAGRRLVLADQVAAAKYGTDQPIDNPAREQQVLESVAALSARTGLDPAVGVRFFRDQIEANKHVQRGLHARWSAHPELRPGHRPDLARVRPELDRITVEAVRQLRATEQERRPSTACRIELGAATFAAELHHRLDGLHREALDEAVVHVCQ